MPSAVSQAQAMAGGILVVAASISALLAILGSLQALQMREWPSVEGMVVTSKAVFSTRVVAGRQKAKSFWTPEVRYRYTVGIREYESDRLTNVLIRGSQASDRKVAETLARYPAGTKILVRYRPDRPEQSIVEITTPATWFWLATAIFAGLRATLALWRMTRIEP